MAFLNEIIGTYTVLLNFIAEFVVCTLELVGIVIIVVGSARAIMQTFRRLRKKQPINIMVELGKSLALALEFKMGAEIVNTVIVRDLRELGVLAIVIGLRAILAILIHWEIKSQHEVGESKKKPDASEEKPTE